MTWKGGKLTAAHIRSKLGNGCRVRSDVRLVVTSGGRKIKTSSDEKWVLEFATKAGRTYLLAPGD